MAQVRPLTQFFVRLFIEAQFFYHNVKSLCEARAPFTHLSMPRHGFSGSKERHCVSDHAWNFARDPTDDWYSVQV